MSYCPKCGKRQKGHLHLGWEGNVLGTKIECDKCGTDSIVFSYETKKESTKEVKELHTAVNKFLHNENGKSGGCIHACM